MSDVLQGVTFEVLSETSLSPLSDATAELYSKRAGDSGVEPNWRSADDYLQRVEGHGVAANFATFVSAATVRINVLGLDDVDPTPEQLDIMKEQVEDAMRDGALGLTNALIYAPATFEEPHQYSMGMMHLLVNGKAVVRDGAHTGAKPGRAVRGPGWIAD